MLPRLLNLSFTESVFTPGERMTCRNLREVLTVPVNGPAVFRFFLVAGLEVARWLQRKLKTRL